MKEKASSSKTLKRVIQNLEGQKHLVVLSFLLALVSVAGTLFVPILVGRAIDEIVGPGQVDFGALGMNGVQIAVTAGVVALSQWLMNIINNKITFCVTREVRQQAFSHLQTLPLSYLDAHPSGEIVSRMISDTEQFADGLLLWLHAALYGRTDDCGDARVHAEPRLAYHAGRRHSHAAVAFCGEVHRDKDV